eukprot:8004375-Alexandrium_andersonii.AAC.1
MLADFEAMRAVDDLAFIPEWLGGRILLLWTGADFRREFQACDVTMLRREVTTVRIAPPSCLVDASS